MSKEKSNAVNESVYPKKWNWKTGTFEQIRTTSLAVEAGSSLYNKVVQDTSEISYIANEILDFFLTLNGENILVSYGEEPVFVDFEQKRAQLYLDSCTDKTPKEFEDFCNVVFKTIATKESSQTMNDLYLFFVDGAMPKVGKPRVEDAQSSKTNKGLLFPFLEWDIIPRFDYDKKLIKNALFAAAQRLNNWVVMDRDTQNNYSKVESSWVKCYSDLPENVAYDLSKFFEEIGNVFGAKDDLGKIRSFNHKFFSFVKNSVLPHFKNGEIVCYGHWVDRNGKLHRYSSKEDVLTILLKFPSLWRYKDIEGLGGACQSFYSFKKASKRSRFSMFDDLKMADIVLGDGGNFLGYDIFDNNDEHSIKIRLKTQEGSFEGSCFYRKKKIKHAKTKELRSKNNCYLENLSIEENGKNYIFTFDDGFGQPIRCHLKQPKLRINRCRKNGFKVELVLNLTQIVDGDKEESKQFRNCANYFLQDEKNGDNAFKTGVKEFLSGREINVLGVDIGINPLFSFHVMRYKDGKVIDSGISGKLGGKHRTYTESIGKCFGIINIIRNMDAYMSNTDFTEEHNFRFLDFSEEDLRKELSEFSTIRDYKKKKRSLIRRSIKQVSLEIGRIRNSRRHQTNQDVTDTIGIINLIDVFLRMQSSFNNVGEDSDTKTTPYCSGNRLRAYTKNLKDNLNKKLPKLLLDLAKKYNCSFVVIERLSDKRSASKRTRRDNAVSRYFSPYMIKEKIGNIFAREPNLFVVEVNEHGTSQFHYPTNTYGVRDKNNKHLFYYEENGKIKPVDSDENAARNIAARFLMKNTYNFTVNVEGDGTNFRSIKTNDDGGPKSKHVRYFEKNGETYKEIEKVTIKNTEIKDTIFMHKDGFLGKDAHNRFLESIVARTPSEQENSGGSRPLKQNGLRKPSGKSGSKSTTPKQGSRKRTRKALTVS